MATVHVRRRRAAALVIAAGFAGLAGVLVLAGLIAGGASDARERGPVVSERTASPSARPAGRRPVDPLAPRAIRSTGDLATVPVQGSPAGDPGGLSFAIEVESGVAIDRARFARAVERTLLDSRGWTADGAFALRRAEGEAAGFIVTLASPATTDRLCAPLETNGTFSCHQNGRAVLNAARWARGADAYGADLARYREYMVNHEVGHALGESHLECPGAGQPAPVMVQQTKGVGACRANPWPLESER